MIQPLFEHRIKLAGFNTRVLELEGDGAPILFFHGYADSADTWRLCLAELGRRGRRAIAVDLPGFGAADRLRSGPILAQLDAFAAASLDYVGGKDERVIAVGNSLGGCVALRLAERRSDRLSGVVAVAPAGLQMSRLIALVERDPVLRSLLALPSPVPRALIQGAVARLYRQLAFARPRSVDQAIVKAFTSHHKDRATVAGYLATAHRLLPELHDPYRFDRVSTRVLIVWGDRDRLVFHKGAERILEEVPGAKLELMPGVGHCPQVEAPDRFATVLLDFSEELSAVA
ncbi:MAG TPA: alpha/beta fold hydrolase [Solirubrobacteraceae bacterium]|jgi:pimeloyl-ACP methyl ester carboxylesterase